jgi:hypothetical protein
VIWRLALALGALVDLGLARLLPETGGGLFLRLGAATIVVMLPGGLVAEALGLRLTSATLLWTLGALALGLAAVFALSTSFTLALLVLLAVTVAAIVLAPRQPRPPRVRGSWLVLAGGVLFGVLLWHVAARSVRGDGLFHLARVRKLVELGDLTPSALNELVGGGLHPGYAFPLWHAFLAAVAKLAGVDPALVVQHESALLVPVALAVAYEAGTILFGSAWLGAATMLAQVALICLAPGHGGAYPVLDLPATAARQLLVPATLALVFMHVREPSRRTLGSLALGALVLALVHPTYALFLCIPLGGWLAVRVLADRHDARRIAEGLAGVALPALAVALALLPIVRETVSHSPSRAERLRAIAHYGRQIVVWSDTHYRIAAAVFARSGAVAVAALALVPLAALAWRRRWSAFVLGGSLSVLLLLLVPFLFVQLSDAVSLSQSRRAAGFVPLAFAFAGGAAVFARLLGIFVLPLALAAGIVLQVLWPGDFGYTLEHGGPALVVWIALVGGGLALLAAAIVRRPLALERTGALAGLAAGTFVLPVAVHAFAHWSPLGGPDAHALTPGLVQALRTDVPKRAVVFSDVETSYRIAAAAPVLLAAAPPSHVADTTKNRPYERAKDVMRFLSTGDLSIPRRYHAEWLVIDRTARHPEIALRAVYADSRYSLYRL